MSPFPEQMVDRWSGRPELPPGHGQLYWHVLLGNQPQVRAMVSEAQRRLAAFSGLDPTPHRWLHMTVLIAGFTHEITPAQQHAMVAEAGLLLGHMQPITVALGRVLYHPEAIALAALPADTLVPLLEAAKIATRTAIQRDGILAHEPWTPHVTVAYSRAVQPAAPIIAALGRELPSCDVTIHSISLVDQVGPEYAWNWHPVAEVTLGMALNQHPATGSHRSEA